MPTGQVSSTTSHALGTTARSTPKTPISTRPIVIARRVPSRAERYAATGAKSPMQSTGIVPSRPASACEASRSSWISSISGPTPTICGRSASAARNSPASATTDERGVSGPRSLPGPGRSGRTPRRASAPHRPAARRLAGADRLEDRDVQLGRLGRLDVRAVQRDRDAPLDAERLPALLEDDVAGGLDHQPVEGDVVLGERVDVATARRGAHRLDLALEHRHVAVEPDRGLLRGELLEHRPHRDRPRSAPSSPNSRTRAPRNGSDSTSRRSSRSRSASRTGAWLVPSSLAMRVSTSRSPGSSSPLTMRWSRMSFTCSRSTVLEMALMEVVARDDYRSSVGPPSTSDAPGS